MKRLGGGGGGGGKGVGGGEVDEVYKVAGSDFDSIKAQEILHILNPGDKHLIINLSKVLFKYCSDI